MEESRVYLKKTATNELVEASLLEYSPYKAVLLDQTRLVWNLVVRRKMPAIWFIRTHRPVTVLLSVLCGSAAVPVTRVLNGEFTEQDFASLSSVCGKFSGAPLWLCDASRPDHFQRGLAALRSSEPITYAFCDWVLKGDELAAVHRLTRESEISFLFPK